MSISERFYVTMPEEIPTFTEGVRVAPNERGNIPVGASVYVLTEDEHFLTFKIIPKGPMEKDSLVSFVESEPPLSSSAVYEGEVYVQDDVIVQGKEFVLDSAFPILAKTAFKAIRIFSNVELVVIPGNLAG